MESPLREPAVNDDPGPGEHVLRYQGRSGRLSPQARPDGTEITTRITSTGPAPALVVWVPSLRVQADAEVVISAALVDEQGAPVHAASIIAVVAAHGSPPGAEMPLSSVSAPDQQFELRLRAPAHPGAFEYVVRARGDFHGEAFDRVAAGAFQVNAAGGRLDASAAKVEKHGGDLTLIVPARIEKGGTYWMYAELWGGPGGERPIAFARDRFENLPAGVRPLAISFGGAVVRESAIDGPYLVRNLRFQQVDAFPPQEGEPVAALAPTAAYRAAEFE